MQLFDPQQVTDQITEQVIESVTESFADVYKELLRSVLAPQMQAMGLSEDEIDQMLGGDKVTKMVENLVNILVMAITQVVVKNAVLGQFESLKSILCPILRPLSMFLGEVEGCEDDNGNGSGGSSGGNETPSSIITVKEIDLSAGASAGTILTIPDEVEYKTDGSHLLFFVNGLLKRKGVDYREHSTNSIEVLIDIPTESWGAFIVFNF